MHIEIFENIKRIRLQNIDNIFVYYYDINRIIKKDLFTDVILFKDYDLNFPFSYNEYSSVIRKLYYNDEAYSIPQNNPFHDHIKLYNMNSFCIRILCLDLNMAGFFPKKKLCKLLHKRCLQQGLHK